MKDTISDIEFILEKAVQDPMTLSPIEISVLSEEKHYNVPTPFVFPVPFDKCFAYG